MNVQHFIFFTALRVHMTKMIDVSLTNALHGEYLQAKKAPSNVHGNTASEGFGWLYKPDFKRSDQLNGGEGTVVRKLAVVNEKFKGK